jgi:exonuclease SbcD
MGSRIPIVADTNSGGKSPLRILHTADLHLTSPGDSGCVSLQAVVDVAIEQSVNLVVVAGDLFEHNWVEDSLLSFAAAQFRRLPVDVIILPGNHDHLNAGSVYERADGWKGCPNVRIFRDLQGETINLPGLGVSLWGKPIGTSAYDVKPLAGIPRPVKNGHWHVAVAHGYYIAPPQRMTANYQISSEEITNSGWDYIALGHIPVFRCVCDDGVKAYYCDSPSPDAGVNIVDFSEPSGVQVTRYMLTR